MTTAIKNLLARKQQLVEQLAKTTPPEERDEIERQLEQVNTALDILDWLGPEGK
jgi:C4-dicarboxylate-specific signal transduction histidine kinase